LLFIRLAPIWWCSGRAVGSHINLAGKGSEATGTGDMPAAHNRKNSPAPSAFVRRARPGFAGIWNSMSDFNYLARAELFLGSDWDTATSSGARVFRRAANALRFAFEEVAPVSLRGARMRIGERQFAGHELSALYASHHYPLPRKQRSRTHNSRRMNDAGHRQG
jgi:hypothetical protein